MKFTKFLKKSFIFALISSFLSMSLQTTAVAAIVDNEQLALESAMQIQRDEVTTFLAREDVRASLLDAGVSSSDIGNRINNLSDTQVMQIRSQMSLLPAGGDSVLGIILVVIVIFILLDIAGATDVFPGV